MKLIDCECEWIQQGYFMMYLYVGSIVAIMCIYITVLLDNCPSFGGGGGGGRSVQVVANHDSRGDP